MTAALSDPALRTSRIELLVNIDVPDLERAVHFYTTALGLHVGRRFGASGVELLGLAAPIYLLVKAAGHHPDPGRLARPRLPPALDAGAPGLRGTRPGRRRRARCWPPAADRRARSRITSGAAWP